MSQLIEIYAPLSGVLVHLERVPDAVFAGRTVGDGVAIDPTSAELLAPVAGVVSLLHRANHALAITSAEGIEVLVHVGIDTVQLAGAGFRPLAHQGDRVVVGQPLLTFDPDFIADRARSLLTPVIITNGDRVAHIAAATGQVIAGRQVVLRAELRSPAGASAGTSGGGSVTSDAVRLPNAEGLHARPAAVLAAHAREFRSDVRLLRGDQVANAKSVTSILLLATRADEPIRVRAVGPDATAAAEALAKLLAAGCGEIPRVTPAAAQPPGPPPSVSPRVPARSGRSLTGIAASPGLAVGRVLQVRREIVEVDEHGEGAERERQRLDAALELGRRQISALKAQLGDTQNASILDAHLELLSDPELIDQTVAGLASGRSAAHVWREVYGNYAARLEQLPNALLRERAADVRDIGGRVLAVLAGVRPALVELQDESIVIAEELTPTETAQLDRGKVLGFCTTSGGATGHAAILARSLGIPAVCAIDPAARALPNGTLVLLDGGNGTLQPDPDAADVTVARELTERHAAQQRQEHAAAALTATTIDGHRIEVAANVVNADEARAAVALGGEGVGLLRSEFLFVDRDVPPTESEQVEAYAAVAAALGPDRRLVIRTLDVGGDKPLRYLPMPAEANPFLGVRGIRASLEHPELFRAQLRAMLRAVPARNLHIMFPMIATLDELRAARALLAAEQGSVNDSAPKVGVMIEVPSAALLAERLAPEVDFFSIGTNDLTQYTLAMDRGHPRLAAQADGLHPSVLRLIGLTVEAAHRHGRWVGVCGGLAGEPAAIPILLGLGVDELSVAVPAIPAVKALVRRLSWRDCRTLATEAIELGTVAEVRARLRAFGA